MILDSLENMLVISTSACPKDLTKDDFIIEIGESVILQAHRPSFIDKLTQQYGRTILPEQTSVSGDCVRKGAAQHYLYPQKFRKCTVCLQNAEFC